MESLFRKYYVVERERERGEGGGGERESENHAVQSPSHLAEKNITLKEGGR